jgi:hypothetical protein
MINPAQKRLVARLAEEASKRSRKAMREAFENFELNPSAANFTVFQATISRYQEDKANQHLIAEWTTE